MNNNTELKSVGEMCDEIKSLWAAVAKLKEERDFFNEEFHKTLQHQADDSEQYEKEISDQCDLIKSLKEELANRVYDKQGAKDCFDLVDQEDLDEANEEIEKLKEGREHDVQQFQTTLEENGSLENEIEELKAENEKLEYWRENEVESPWEAIIMIKELTDENKKLKDQVFHEHTKDEIKEIYRVSMELKEENKKLFKFTIGGGEESEVEKIIMEKMNKEFIDGNQEHWDDIGLFLTH